jgi:hypothetical protein
MGLAAGVRRDIVPLGRTKGKWNYSLDEKRVLNFENVVNDDDNIKQDLSIDVYGRAEKEEDEAVAAAAPEQEEAQKVPCFPPGCGAEGLSAWMLRWVPSACPPEVRGIAELTGGCLCASAG